MGRSATFSFAPITITNNRFNRASEPLQGSKIHFPETDRVNVSKLLQQCTNMYHRVHKITKDKHLPKLLTFLKKRSNCKKI